MKYSNLQFIEFTKPKFRADGVDRKRANFKCDCGVIENYCYYSVIGGRQKSCRACTKETAIINRRTHNLISHPLYGKWQDMKNRCRNPKVDRYENYGGRGIRVCDDWDKDFKSFYDWSISNGWSKGLTIDRKDVNGNYTPDNCEYITMREQGFNKRNTFYVYCDGKKYSLAKVLYLNGVSNKRAGIWRGIVKTGRPFSYYVDKLNLELY